MITSLDLAKRENILAGLQQVHWDLVIVDEAHRMSWTPPSRKTARYALGELLRDHSDHILLLTATPHKGDPENFSLFLQLLDRGRLRRREVDPRGDGASAPRPSTCAAPRRRWSTSRSASRTARG